MKAQIAYPDLRDVEKMCEVATELFGTEEDQTQAQPTVENTLRLIAFEKHSIVCTKEAGEIIGWSVVLPTSKELMEKFLNKVINERELFDLAVAKPSFESLYLVAAIVLPEWRKRGIGTLLMMEQIEYFMKRDKVNDFYALILTPEGERLTAALERELHIKILCRKG